MNGGGGNPVPTGAVQVAAVGYTPAAVALVNGAATLTIPPGSLIPGAAGLAITYIPDTGQQFRIHLRQRSFDRHRYLDGPERPPHLRHDRAARARSRSNQPLSVTVNVAQANRRASSHRVGHACGRQLYFAGRDAQQRHGSR